MPDGYPILVLAERFGRSPEEVENWDLYWFNRAIEWLEGEGRAMNEKMKKNKAR